MTVVSFADVAVDFGGTTLLRNVGFTVAAGECWGIVGRNGAGKTTLFRLITGDLEPTRGVVFRPTSLRIALLDQLRHFGQAVTVWDAAAAGYREAIALERQLAVLDDIAASDGVTARYHLGDVVGYAPWPNETGTMLREAGIVGITGNYDSTVATDYKHCGCKYEDPRQEELSHISYGWTRGHVTAETQRFPGHVAVSARPAGAKGSSKPLIDDGDLLGSVGMRFIEELAIFVGVHRRSEDGTDVAAIHEREEGIADAR